MGDFHSELPEALLSYDDNSLPGTAWSEHLKTRNIYIKVSLAHGYNGSLVLKTEEKSLSQSATFLTSAI